MGIITTPYLKKKIASTKKEINQINTSIEQYEKGIEDAEHARESLEKSISEINVLADETSLYFQGSSADQFQLRLQQFISYCSERSMDMQNMTLNYNKCIGELKNCEQKCKKTINELEDLLKICKWSLI